MNQYVSIFKKPLKKKFLLFLITFFFFHYFSTSVMAQIPALRVGILLGQPEVSIKGDQGIVVYQLPEMKKILTIGAGKSLTFIGHQKGMIIEGQTYQFLDEIKITPLNGGLIQVEDWKYRGEIEICRKNHFLDIINVIELEQYLCGVLKKEISPDWPVEALKAQAIAARTFALSNMNKYIENGYNICATTNSQAYGGVNHEHPNTNKAVYDTQGIIALYEGDPINAVYHSDSGGYTENSEDVWGGYVPYLRSVSSEFESIVSPPNHEWMHEIKEKDLLSCFSKNGYQLNGIKDIIVNQKTKAGRVVEVDIYSRDDQKLTMKANDLRLLLGPTLVRSSFFEIHKSGEIIENINQIDEFINENPEKENSPKQVREILSEERDFSISELIALLNRPKEEEITKKTRKTSHLKEIEEAKTESEEVTFAFAGKGNGHGVGLSQWGAFGMATQGYSYEEILKYYYQGIELKKIY